LVFGKILLLAGENGSLEKEKKNLIIKRLFGSTFCGFKREFRNPNAIPFHSFMFGCLQNQISQT
jgi:hypothetical protein